MSYQGTCMIIALNSPVFNEMYSIYNWFRQARFGVTTHSNDFSLQGMSNHFLQCPFDKKTYLEIETHDHKPILKVKSPTREKCLQVQFSSSNGYLSLR